MNRREKVHGHRTLIYCCPFQDEDIQKLRKDLADACFLSQKEEEEEPGMDLTPT